MAKMTKAQAKRAMVAINQKRNRLFENGFFTINDVADISKVIERASKRLK